MAEKKKYQKTPPPSPEQCAKIVELFDQKVPLLDIAGSAKTTRSHVLRTLKNAGKWDGKITKVKEDVALEGSFNVDERENWLI